MRRREFLQGVATAAAGLEVLSSSKAVSALVNQAASKPLRKSTQGPVSVEGYTQVSEFKAGNVAWKVFEDLRTRDGSIVFQSSAGATRLLTKSADASMPEGTLYLGLSLKDIGTASNDLLAEKLLQNGDPDLEAVKSAAPPVASGEKNPRAWSTFVGTKEAYDVTPVYRSGSTRTYHPVEVAHELHAAVEKGQIYDGLVGGWMPAARKVIPISGSSYWEVIVFGDTAPIKNKYIVQTWHRTVKIEDNKITKIIYGHTYPAYPPGRTDPKPEGFYRALLAFADYWDSQIEEFADASLPDNVFVDMSKHSFAKELMTRPAGLYPKYGAVDRDYAGSEYDGFQDIFTSAIYTNMEWGRLATARLYIDHYFTEYVDDKGLIDMRGPETAQYGLTLSLLARYYNYTRDNTLMLKHRGKIEATAKLLADMHDESLQLPKDKPGYGLISGWSESDSCLAEDPSLYWQPYYANSAFAARGFKDLAQAWSDLASSSGTPAMQTLAAGWLKRSKTLQDRTVECIEKNIQSDKTPPYIGLFPGTTLTFRESLEQEKPSTQQWPHRPYAELLQADMLPPKLANLVVDCMKAHGCTTLGVVANVWRFQPDGREILGFISYGHAQMLLRLDRIEEFLLFLYTHRFHDHTRGSWVAGEVTNINGDSALYCMPAQQTIPLLVRWMLVLDDSDEDRLYLAKGIPREWLATEKEIKIENAPTRWGKVSFTLGVKPDGKSVVGHAELTGPKTPKELHFKLRTPPSRNVRGVTVNGKPAKLEGLHNDTVIIATGGERKFEVVGQLA